MDLNAAIAELGQAISGSGIGVHSVFLSTGTATYPAAVIQPPDEIRYLTTLGGMCEVDIRVSLFTNATDRASAFKAFYTLLSYTSGEGSNSVPDALRRAEFAYIKSCIVQGARDFNVYDEAANILTVDLYLTLKI